MRFFIALLVGKIVRVIGKILGKGSNLPGKIALKIYPNLLSKFKLPEKVVIVTGVNGKTTTSNMIAHILENAGLTVTNNKEGSNLNTGVTTALLETSNLLGNIKTDAVVLEMDELYVRYVLKHIKPSYLVVTNLFRDQTTRFGHLDVLISKLKEEITGDIELVLNADDPLLYKVLVADNQPVHYFGVDKTRYSTKEDRSNTNDAGICPKCHGDLEYEYYQFSHIGRYQCSECEYHRPETVVEATNINFKSGVVTLNDKYKVKPYFNSIYNVYNMTAAATVCTLFGINYNHITEGLTSFKAADFRVQKFQYKGRDGLLLASKGENPVSFTQSLLYIRQQERTKTVIINVNNIFFEYQDITWVWECDYELLIDEHIDKVIFTGSRAYDAAVRLKYVGFPEDKILIVDDINDVKPTLATKTEGDIYVLPSLTESYFLLKDLGLK